MAILRARYPDLAKRVDLLPDKDCVRIFKAKDGGVAYGMQKNGRIQPITDPEAPLAKIQAQFDQWAQHLADNTRPVLVVGLYPGNELFCLFDNVESNQTPHCQQPVWVCIDSICCLCAFLRTWDASRVLESPRVHFFWYEEMSARVQWLGEHPEFPHVFTLITGAGDKMLNQVIPPIANLVQQRDVELRKLMVENGTYYDAVTDAVLAERIGQRPEVGSRKSEVSNQKSEVSSPPASLPTSDLGPRISPFSLSSFRLRRPRIMMPTVTWSTFVQHSARDTAAAFEEMGWEVRVLKMDAMLTPYYLVKTINEFKPDVFLFIDHMRYEAEEIYPRNMMFLTWIQDDMPNLQCRRAGEKLAEYAATGRRDLVVGYIQGLEENYGFPKDRLVPLLIPANPRIFHPVELTEADRAKYGCDLAFMTNTSMSSEQVIEQKIIPQVEPLGISRATCMQIHADLWALYRSGAVLIDPKEFLAWIMRYPEFTAAWDRSQRSEVRDRRSEIRDQKSEVSSVPASLPTSDLGPTTSSFSPSSPTSDLGPRTLSSFQCPDLKTKIAKEHEEEAVGASYSPQSTVHSLTSDDLLRLFYWRLNDTIYRHVVLEWADELVSGGRGRRAEVRGPRSEGGGQSDRKSSVSAKATPDNEGGIPSFSVHSPPPTANSPQSTAYTLHLYGHGWENHPRFAKYARGPIEHGVELNKAYQAARWCLHLNIAQGMHQRMHEIIASGGNLLVRTPVVVAPGAGEPSRALMRRLAAAFRLRGEGGVELDSDFDPFSDDICRTPEEKSVLIDWVFHVALALTRQDAVNGTSVEHRLIETIRTWANARIDWNIEDFESHSFNDRAGFERAMGSEEARDQR